MTREELLDRIKLNVIQGRRNREDEGLDEELTGTPGVVELVEEALNEGVEARVILVDAISSGMDTVGDRYEDGSYFLPDMLTAAEAVESAMEVLEPHLLEAGIEPSGRIVLATVKGDMHDIGKNIVGLMMKGAGFEVVDLGNDVEPGEIVRAVRTDTFDLLGMSALLTTTMVRMGETIDELVNQGVREEISVIVGGAPLTPDFALDIGADGYGKDAFEAVRLAREFTAK